MIQYLGISAGFAIILLTFALAFFIEKKATTIHLVLIAVGAALAGVSNLSVKTPEVDLSFTQTVAQQGVDAQTAIEQLSERVSSLEQANQQTLAALKSIAEAQQKSAQANPKVAPPAAAQAIIQGLEANQAASVQRQTKFAASLKTLQLSTAHLATAARIAPPPRP